MRSVMILASLVLMALVPLAVPVVILSHHFRWTRLRSLVTCCWRRPSPCCYIHYPNYHGLSVGKRPWPLLSYAGLSKAELQQEGKERRARRERYHDRDRDRDSRRQYL